MNFFSNERVIVYLQSARFLAGIPSGRYDLPAGTTLRELLYMAGLALHELKKVVAIVNGQRKASEYLLQDGDHIRLLVVLNGRKSRKLREGGGQTRRM